MIDKEIFKLCKKFGSEYDVDPYLIFGIIKTESAGNEYADSGYARGLMQMSRIALKDIQKDLLHKYEYSDLFNPEINVEVGTIFLKKMLTHWEKKYDENYLSISLAILSYAWGITNSIKWLKSVADNSQIDESIPEKKKYYNENVMFWMSFARERFNA
jgi:soluble lytic murein transglycosylase